MLICPNTEEDMMAGRDIIMATQKELRVLHTVHKVLEGAITQAEAAVV